MSGRVSHGSEGDRSAVRQDLLLAARAVIDFAAPGYGPMGGHKLVEDDGHGLLLNSPASALREVRIADPIARPYKALAESVQAAVGDQGTAAILLASRLVANALESGVPVPAILDGYALARRQALARLASLARTDDGACLGSDGPAILDGLRELADAGGSIDLDQVDVRCEPGEWAWHDGLLIEPKHAPDRPRATDVAVLVVAEGPRFAPADARFQVSDPRMLGAMQAHEAEQRRSAARRIRELGIGLLVAPKDLDDEWARAVAADGTVVVTDAPRALMRRLRTATGATPVPRLDDADAAALGRADLERRPPRRGGWVVRGPGPSATLCLPASIPARDAARMDGAERTLRAAGAFLEDARSVPGDGSWQRTLARALRKAAPHASGKAAMGVEGAADAFGALADDLVRAGGGDPLSPPESGARRDPYVAVRFAIEAAFDVAASVLRLDGHYAKRPSTPEALRGGAGPAGSPKGLPGDVPPLM